MQAHASSYIEADRLLQEQNRYIIHIDGMDECLFRCISQAFMSTDQYNLTYREQTVAFMWGRDAAFGPYVDGDYNEHLLAMREQITWSTDAEIVAAVTMFDTNINIFTELEKLGHGISMSLNLHFKPLDIYT